LFSLLKRLIVAIFFNTIEKTKLLLENNLAMNIKFTIFRDILFVKNTQTLTVYFLYY